MEFLTIPEAAKRVGKTERTIREWIRKGKLIRVGGKVHTRNLLAVDAEMYGNQVRPLDRSSIRVVR